jgi:hypothetical protein
VDSNLASRRGILAWDLPAVYFVNGVRSAAVDSNLASRRGILAWDLPAIYFVNGVRSAKGIIEKL